MNTPEQAHGRTSTALFSQPIQQVLWMLIILGLVGAGSFFAWPVLQPVIWANIYLNSVILGVFALGVFACFYQILQLTSSVSWIKGFVEERAGMDTFRAPQLLASLATLLGSRGSQMQISSSSSGSILGSVGTRMDEARDITRYIVNLLIFLGLLGTFYGLATTIPGVVDTIKSLNTGPDQDGAEVFGRLMSGLQTQLSGMGTAFASSLLGLAGSLIVGLLELFAGHGQNRFYREMEEWLSSITRVGFSSGEGEGGGFDQGVVATVLDHMVEQIDSLQGLFVQAENSRRASDEKLEKLSGAVLRLAVQMEQQMDPTDALIRVADGQDRLITHLADMQEKANETDPESRMRLRSIDVQMLKILEEISAGRQESMAQMHADMAQLSQVVRANTETKEQG
ncbi:MAG: biopolymer transporter ExbB [Litoreibacter sp.]